MAQLEQERVVGRLLWEGVERRVGLGEELVGNIPEEKHAARGCVSWVLENKKKVSKLTFCWWYCAIVLMISAPFHAG
jgi:hypothetical protein